MSAPKPETPSTETPKPPRKSMLKKVTILSFIVAVVVGECVAALLFLQPAAATPPAGESGEEAAAPDEDPHADAEHGDDAAHGEEHAEEATHGEEPHGEHGEEPAAHGEEGHGEEGEGHDASKSAKSAPEIEVDLGEFSVMSVDPASDTTLLIECHVFGIVIGADESAYLRAYEPAQHRIRDQVIVIIRSAEMEDLTDPALGLIKRQIMTKCNTTLGKPLLKGVMFSKFSFIEQ